ncbi:hypothetical protein B566_EDAN018196 [Ephemera danica]|nr:hypothetical protein B566_EDAN018196 [Ephemera danica]
MTNGSCCIRQIEDRKLDFKVQSKVGSLANVTHKPGGGDVKIFDDKEYIRQMSGTQTNSTGTHSKASSEGQPSGTQSPVPCSPGAAGMSQQSPLSPSRS